MDISEILKDLDLIEYIEAFRRHRIDGEILATLTSQDLLEIGVEAIGDRKRILGFVAHVNDSNRIPRTREQRRPVTILFADMVGSTAISQAIDSEDMRHLIRAYHAIAREAAVKYDGRIVQFLGDGIYAYFGYPRAHEDDPERAVRMGYHLIENVAKLNASWSARLGRKIQIRVGIESGRVVVGSAENADDRQSVLLTGEAPNVAAHLQGAAEVGNIVVGPKAARLLTDIVQTTPLVSGPKIPQGSVRVDGFLQGEDPSPISIKDYPALPFVGRKDELLVLRRALADVRTGNCRCIAISGEAGIGKSRLVEEFLSDLPQNTHVYSASCASLDGTAYQLVRQLLRKRSMDLASGTVAEPGEVLHSEFEEYGPRMKKYAPYLLHTADFEKNEQSIAQDLIGVRVREGLVEMARASGEGAPTVFYFNDLHWIDERSEDALSYMLEQSTLRGVLIICSFRKRFRANWLNQSHVTRLELSPLDAKSSADLFERLSTQRNTPDSDLLASTGGNPYYISELARMDDPNTRSADDSSSVPISLQSLMQERIDRLSPQALGMIRAASVAGLKFNLDDIMPPDDERNIALAELEQHGFLRPVDISGERFGFMHALLQESVYAGLVRDDLAHIHREVAARIEQKSGVSSQDRSEELARHFKIANEPLRAARYAFLSGKKASSVFALKDASKWFDTVLSLLPETLSDEDLSMRREAVSQLINIKCWSAEFSEMVHLAESELEEFDRDASISEVARFKAWLAEGYTHNGRIAEARSLLEDVLSITQSSDARDARGLALSQYAWLLSLDAPTHDKDRRDALLEELAQLAANDVENSYAALMRQYADAAASMHAGDYSATLLAADNMIALGEANGYPPASCWGHCFRAFVEADTGNVSEALDHCETAGQSALCVYDQLTIALCKGSVLHRLERFDEALEELDLLRRRIPEAGMFHFSHLALAAEGHARLLAGDETGQDILVDKAEEYLSIGYDTGGATLLTSLGAALLQRKQFDAASSHLERAAEIAIDQGMTRLLAEAKSALGHCASQKGRQDEAQVLFGEAETLAQSLNWFPLEQRLRAARVKASRTLGN